MPLFLSDEIVFIYNNVDMLTKFSTINSDKYI